MSGTQEYNKAYLNKINTVLENQPDYIKGFINFIHKKAFSTRYAYLRYVIGFINYVNKHIENITLDDFSEYLNFIEYKKNGEETTQSYKIAVYSALKSFSTYLYKTKKISNNYMLDLERPKFYENQNTIQKRNDGYLTKKEMKKYIKAVEGDKINSWITNESKIRDIAIINVFLSTGIRCSALSKLDITDFDPIEKTIIVMDKGNKVKVYNIPDNVVQTLQNWLYIRKDLINSKEDALFISVQTKNKRRISNHAIINIINKYSENSLGKHLSPHKLRATYGTLLYNETKDLVFVQDCMGHSNSKTTELYIRDKKENAKKASDIMSRLLRN